MKRPWDAIVWWEVRRIPYNIVLALLGSVTGITVLWIGSHFVLPGEDVEEPLGMLVGAILYGIAANIFYTLGWISELLWSGRRYKPDRIAPSACLCDRSYCVMRNHATAINSDTRGLVVVRL
jgi:hypothetical protein